MKSIDDEPPSSELFPEGCKSLDPEQRRSVMMLAITQVVNAFVDVSYGNDGEADKEHSEDLILSYACESLTLGLFLMEFINAIREGDGLIIVRCWRYFLLLFKTTGRTMKRSLCLHSSTSFSPLNWPISSCGVTP